MVNRKDRQIVNRIVRRKVNKIVKLQYTYHSYNYLNHRIYSKSNILAYEKYTHYMAIYMNR